MHNSGASRRGDACLRLREANGAFGCHAAEDSRFATVVERVYRSGIGKKDRPA